MGLHGWGGGRGQSRAGVGLGKERLPRKFRANPNGIARGFPTSAARP